MNRYFLIVLSVMLTLTARTDYIGFEQKGRLVTFDPKSHVRMSPTF